MYENDYLDIFGISHDWLIKIFPFYLVVSEHNKIIDKGPGFDWLDVVIHNGGILENNFKPLYFFKKLSYDYIKNDSDEEVILKDLNDLYTLKGKAYFFSKKNVMLFMSSISIHDSNLASKIKLQNFEPYNQTLDMIFLKVMQESESKKSLALIQKLEKKAHDLTMENKKISSGRVVLDGKKIKSIRQSKLMTMDGFVDESHKHKCYISKSTLKRAEAGVKVYFKTAIDISEILDVDVHEIIQ